VLLNAGASATNINILQGDQSVFTRDISIGGNAYTEALQRELNLSFDTADGLKRGHLAEGVTYDEARPVLRAVTENVMLEIQKTFDFFKATAASDKIDRIMLSGGASRAEGFTEMLTERFEAPVEGLDPFKRVGLDVKKLQVDAPAEVAPTAAVAVGLALRRVGDR
jgi:type IV pilus assembly protein PilM